MRRGFIWVLLGALPGLGCEAKLPEPTASKSATPRPPPAKLVQHEYPFRDPRLSADARASDIVRRLTLKEKIAQLSHSAPAVERPGIPAYNWWNEALHGVARSGRATVFPRAIGMAATFDPALIKQVASAIPKAAFAVVTESGERRFEPGTFIVHAGSAAPVPRAVELGAPQPLKQSLELTE